MFQPRHMIISATNLEGIQAWVRGSCSHPPMVLDARFRDQGPARRALEDVVADLAASDAKVQAAFARMGEAHAAVALERRAVERERAAVLTPEQNQALAAQRAGRGPGQSPMVGPRGGADGWGDY